MSAVLRQVVAESPAARAGLRDGDQIVSVDGRSIACADGLLLAIPAARDGQALRLRVRRNGSGVLPLEFDLDVLPIAADRIVVPGE